MAIKPPSLRERLNKELELAKTYYPDDDSMRDGFAEGIVEALKLLDEVEAEASQPQNVTTCGGRDYCSRRPFCSCGAPQPFPERDPEKPAEQQGIFRKYEVRRADGSDQPGGKHYGCYYFVLDLTHDQHAIAAILAYAAACRATHPELADDIELEFGEAQPQDVGRANPIIDWLNSDEGRRKLVEAGARAEQATRELNRARAVDPALMLTPIGAAQAAPVPPAPNVTLAMAGAALDEWLEKTNWVQEQISTFPLQSLGCHRADVMRAEIERLRAVQAVPAVPENWSHVFDEVKRATQKFPTWPTDPLHAIAVLGEEFGELTKAALQTTYEPHKVKDGELRTEAIQTAAMALRFLASLDRYEFEKCAQHEQSAPSSAQPLLRKAAALAEVKAFLDAELIRARGYYPDDDSKQEGYIDALETLRDNFDWKGIANGN